MPGIGGGKYLVYIPAYIILYSLSSNEKGCHKFPSRFCEGEICFRKAGTGWAPGLLREMDMGELCSENALE